MQQWTITQEVVQFSRHSFKSGVDTDSEGKGGPAIDNVQGRYASEDLRANMLPIQGTPQQQVWGQQPPFVGVTQFVPHPPFPPPVPRASPEQLLQEIRQGLSGYELTRLVAIEATQRVLPKHLSEMAAIDEIIAFCSQKGRKCRQGVTLRICG